jgi:predicted naringenin-chalcone synthase
LHGLRGGGEDPGTTLLVAVELCSLHLQTEPTRDNILSNMIFADGCAAALFSRDPVLSPRLDLLFTASYLFPQSSGFMGWKIGNTGFEMMLSSELPRIIEQEAAPALERILKEQGIERSSVRHWALHPGGSAILDALQSGLRLEDHDMAPSRAVLRHHGNMSSPSILFVLKELLDTRRIAPAEVVCAVAFGPGLTMEVTVMKGV